MNHGFTRIVVPFILLALFFSALGVAPARAAGPLTHNDVVRAARELLPASELKTILQDYPGAALSGSVYPDWGIVYAALTGNNRYSDYTENAHSAEFTTAYLNIVRGYAQPYDEYEKKSIAFLFGLIAHKTSDDAFHNGFLPVAYQADNGGVEDHGLIEFGVDSFNTVYSAGYNTDWFFPFLEVWAAYMELYDNGKYSYDPPSPTDLLLGFEAYVTESKAQVAAAYPALAYYYFRLPNTRDLMRDPDVAGSMPNMTYLTKEKWLATWNVFGYTGAYHVKPTASGTGDCRSWENACTLQTALNIPYGSNEVWVMGGEYKPTDGTDRAATFQLRYGLSVYGGFAGTETTRDQRDPATNVTILSGDIDPAGDNDSYHVVMGVTGSTLNGFTVTKGNANGASPDDIGGGMNNIGQPTVSNVIFTGNAATRGGGAYNKNWEWYNPDASAVFTNVTFNNNSSTWGGGVYNYLAQPMFTNITFSGNSASQNGGGMMNEASSPKITNVTFSGNQAGGSGGGMRNESNSNSQIVNSIFWGNTAVTSDPQISNVSSIPAVSYSVVSGLTDISNGNTGNDPNLGTLGNYGGFTQTIPLQEGSSAIDAGNDAACPATDQHGLTRPQREGCDIGAFELGIPAVGLSVTSHNFGYQEVSTTSSAFTVTLTNTGNDILHIGTLEISGEFALSGDNCSSQIVAPSGTCAFEVTFSPLTAGAKAVQVSIPSDAATSPDTVDLSGNGFSNQTLRFRSNGVNDGMARESAETSGIGNYTNSVNQMIAVGDDSLKRQYVGILDFDTSSLPDNAVITSAKLQVKVMMISNGVYAKLGDLTADVTSPYFGTSPGLQNMDFGASALANAGVVTKATTFDQWITLKMKAGNLTAVNLLGRTQFRLRFTLDDSNDALKHQIGFLSGNYSIVADRPLLIVTYYIP